MERKVLILQSFYGRFDGSSNGLNGYLNDNKSIISFKILCRQSDTEKEHINVVKTWQDVYKELRDNDYDVIHYFKTSGYELFEWTVHALKVLGIDIPIITTVNQQPSIKGLLLSPFELKHSNQIVFIDKTAYNDPLLSFIPEDKKSIIYYTTSQLNSTYETLKEERGKRRGNNHVIFGRASTLSKCPKNVIDIFNAIPFENKEFRIYGIPEKCWLSDIAHQFNNVSTFSPLPLHQWLREMCKLDVFLYLIPKDSHSSLDGTLGAAMKLGIPVVYYGSEAPKERLIHGVNAMVAETEEEFIRFADELAKDPSLRKRLGESAIRTEKERFSWETSVRKYNELYATKQMSTPVNIPLKYKWFFLRKSYRYIIATKLKGGVIERLYRIWTAKFSRTY